MSETETIKSLTVIKVPSSSKVPYYCTEDDWRNYTGFTNQSDFPSNEVALHLKNATEQVKKDGFHMVRFELVTKDSSDRYFTSWRYWANRYGADADGKTEIIHGEASKYDLQMWEADLTSSVAASLALQGTRINRLMYKIPYDGITDIDALNGFFKLTSDYPTETNRQIYVSYWVSGKPLSEISYELNRACMEMTTVLALNKLKTKRLRKGTTSYTLGKQTITRDEATFDKMIQDHMKEYHKWIRWFKPFIGRRVRIGKMETYTHTRRRFSHQYQ